MATANPLERIFSGDYGSEIQPIVSVCIREDELGSLDTDSVDNSVKVFDGSGKIMLKFGDEEGEGKMYGPIALAICRDRILISQNFWILNYQMNGGFISRIGKRGEGDLEFDYLRGLTFDESNGEVYICDSDNNRIQILSKELTYKTQFGQDNLKTPLDVKLRKEFIYILDESNPCLHLYNYNLILHKSIISREDGLLRMNPWYFCIDNSNNIYFTDYYSDEIMLVDSQFYFKHTKFIASLTGITVDNKGRVIVVCTGGLHML
ncbi:hypothetical protein LOD99_8650 [Oopsacas minuta]|uniref:Uncharacterized protein n=1 Tax=Oopsacas minuta TaxID=111878 RepID=A0AAV7JFM8_9METZ|nr:hypothetical protein LOD99_8650 [Oopsacas minuta]